MIGSHLYATRKLAIYFSDMFHRIFDVNNNNNNNNETKYNNNENTLIITVYLPILKV